VLGFVSLLLMLEGKMQPTEWFQGDSDISLPTQTLLVCPMTAVTMNISILPVHSEF
jgi:hypothetical protein